MSHNPSVLDPWAAFRFSVVGPLLASPPKDGELQHALDLLAEKSWRHPVRPDAGFLVGRSTIERWYYTARDAPNPAFSQVLLTELELLYTAYPKWSYQLHFDNLKSLVESRPELGELPSYNTVRRAMHARGWLRRKQPRRKETDGQLAARLKLESREIRSFEATHVHGLWHSDFHHGSLQVVDAQGTWHVPQAACVLDDKSRLCCHIQWYLEETTENFVHTLTQAIFKRGLPREFMTDNGGPMTAAETVNGLKGLSILHTPTLPYSPYQNGKQEHFWGSLERRLMAMLENVRPLTLDLQASFQQLSAVRVPSVSDPTAKKEADTALDVAWKNLHDSLVSWNNTAAPANADPEGTKRLMSFLFADGLKFTRAKYLEEWEASQSRIAGLARDPAYTQTIARHNLQVLLQVVQDAHAAYGAALGITQPAEVSDSTAVRDALKEVTFRLRIYVLQVVAYGYSHVIDAPTLAEALLEPLAVWVSPVPEKATASEPATAGAVSTTSPPAGTA